MLFVQVRGWIQVPECARAARDARERLRQVDEVAAPAERHRRSLGPQSLKAARRLLHPQHIKRRVQGSPFAFTYTLLHSFPNGFSISHFIYTTRSHSLYFSFAIFIIINMCNTPIDAYRLLYHLESPFVTSNF